MGRRYGAEVCYTPMFHSRIFGENAQYRALHFTTNKFDRPLIVQFCGDNPETMLKAAILVQDQCDAVDVNLGCPQHIARKGHYGSYLQDEWELIESIVKTLHEGLKVPVTCKIRIFPDVEKTVCYAKMIEAAGAQLLTVHGRLREQKGHNTGLADWSQIKRVVEAVKIPVFANGNILTTQDCDRCILETGAVGVMSAEAHLYNPAIFSGKILPVWDVIKEYLELAKEHPAPISFVRGHLFKLFRKCLNTFTEHRSNLGSARSFEELEGISLDLCKQLEIKFNDLSEIERNEIVEAPSEERIQNDIFHCTAYIRPDFAVNIKKTIEDDDDDKESNCQSSKKLKVNH